MSDPEPMRLEFSESQNMSDALGVQASGPDGEVKSVRVVDGKGQRLTADVLDDGSVRVRIDGKGIPGQADEISVCQILVNRLRADGVPLASPEAGPKSERENGVDIIVRRLDGGKPLQVQVTRVDPDESLWQSLAVTGVAEKNYPCIDALAGALRAAISKKCHRPQKDIILVVNGTQLPTGLPSVRRAFETRHNEWLRRLHFDAVWVVESFQDNNWTSQLYSKDEGGSENGERDDPAR